MYNVKSLKAEEFISDEEIKETLEYAEANKNNIGLIDAIIEKAKLKKGLTHREASVLLACEIPEKLDEVYKLAQQIKKDFYGNRIVLFAPLYLSNYCVNGCVYCPYHMKNKHIARKKLTQEEIVKEVTALQDMGHKRLAIEAGEDPVNNPIEYILECINTTNLDLAILDVMLPDIDGYTLCQKIRTRHTYPIIMLTAKDGETDKINGLTLGADDYMTKPFRPLELVARVKSQLRRYKKYNPAQAEAEAGDVMTHAGLEMNVKTHQCLLDGKSLTLTPTEFSILQILLESKGTVVSAEELFYRIWADEYYSKTNNTITSHIRHLREKLNDTMDNPKYIRTIWGVGYKIED